MKLEYQEYLEDNKGKIPKWEVEYRYEGQIEVNAYIKKFIPETYAEEKNFCKCLRPVVNNVDFMNKEYYFSLFNQQGLNQ